jgi:hypothetical protein
MVKLSHPDGEKTIADVPMLIDSGADATLLPRSAVASLGLVSRANGINWRGSTA